MASVYIGHIAEDDRQKIIDIASSVGKVISSTQPQLSEKKIPGIGRKARLLPTKHAYYMFVTMETSEQARKLVSSIGSTPFDVDFDYGFDTISGVFNVPRLYANM